MEPRATVVDVQACRSCLSIKEKLLKISPTYGKMYESISGLQISKTDGFPNYFCALCCRQMKKTMAFRKKCRRAFFVLKEIAFRHKVTNDSIAQVDLKKTNLLPSCDVWTLDNCGVYNMCESGGDASAANDGLTGDDGNRNLNCIVTDIKPDNWKEIEEDEKRLEEMKRMEEEAIERSLAEHEDMGDDGAVDNVDVEPDFDMEDIFKDFKEETEEHDFDWPHDGPKASSTKTVKENKQNKYRYLNNKDIMALKVLEHCTIDTLTPEEQAEVWELRENMASYQYASFKCSICLISLCSQARLKAHANVHLAELKVNKLSCKVCKRTFGEMGALRKHRFEVHQYKYTCNKCGDVLYNWQAIVGHTAHEDRLTVSQKRLEDVKPLKPDSAKQAIVGHTAHEDLLTVSQQRLEDVEPLNPGDAKQAMVIHTEEHFTVSLQRLEDVEPLKPGYAKYPCNLCPYEADTSEQHIDHLQLHVKWGAKIKEFHCCTICHCVITELYDLKAHMEKHRSIIYTCNHCKTVFKSKDGVKAHVEPCVLAKKKSQEEELAIKDGVGATTDDTGANEEYIGATKDDKGATNDYIGATGHDVVLAAKSNFCCHICGQEFVTMKRMNDHMILGHGQGAWSCPECGKYFLSKDSLFCHQLHMHKHINVPGPLAGLEEFECKDCVAGATRFDNAQALARHRRLARHKGAAERTPCPDCCKVFESTLQKDRHLCRKDRKNYLKTYPRTCQCGYVAEKPMKYFLHRRKHHNPLHKRMCEECGLLIARPSFKSHQALVHGITAGGKVPVIIECRFCCYVSSSVNVHAWHVVTKHTARPWQCALCDTQPYCERSYARMHVLKTHAPVRPYHCAFCPRQFTLLSDYATHAADAHNANVRTKRVKQMWLTAMRNKRILFTIPHVKVNVGLLEPEYQSQFVLNISDYTDMSVLPIPAEEKYDYLITECTHAPINVDPLKAEHIDWSNLVLPSEDEDVLRVENEQKAKKLGKINVKYAPVSVGSKDIVWSDTELPADDSKVMEGSKRVKKTKRKRVRRKVEKIKAVEEDYGATEYKSKVKKRKSKYLGEKAGNRGRDMMDLDILNAVQQIQEDNVVEDDKNFLIQGLEDIKDEELEVDYDVIEEEVVAEPPLELFDNEGNPLEVIENEGEQYVVVKGVMYKVELE